MKPYYQDALATIYHGDSRQILSGLEGYNVILTDPPWLLQRRMEIRGGERPAELFAEVMAAIGVKVDRLMIQLGSSADPRMLYAVPSSLPFLTVAVLRLVPPARRGCVLCWGDAVYIFGRGYLNGNGKRLMPGLTDVPSMTEDRNRSKHPCPRNLVGLDWLVGNYCRPTDTVMDPLMGSGTTLIAAKYGGRKCIGIEIEERWCEEAAKALAQTTIEEIA